MNNLDFNAVENLRKVMGTLPSERPTKKTNILKPDASIEVTLEDYSNNPYKAMFVTSTSTWGTNEFEQKWKATSLEGKLEVIKAVLTHNTLPQAKEMVQFVFRVKGVPRWLFDYHTQAVQFIAFMSIGCRDNNKIDSDVVIDYLSLDKLDVFSDLKDLYELALTDNQGSWQTARAFLPQSYSHSYHFGQNLLSIVGTKGFHASKKFGDNYKDIELGLLYRKVQAAVNQKFPLLGYYLEILFNDNEKVFENIRNMNVDMLSIEDLKLFNQD
jgi:hypothetical protein